ncbi:family 16 glycosylhydrolase [Tropicimonas marinistellae]|uniref:family 16 glycosylhydrolase n=1 Tax=Tropicimonas marinistellae TaxID=1739787 RepID=UPI000836C976|nr:family 16 glycosylhydrolase [Tropicimonas marinistellae]
MSFTDNFDTIDQDFWYLADFSIANSWQWTAWEADYIKQLDGEIALEFDATTAKDKKHTKDYTGSEIQSKDYYGYGYYEVDMIASGESGVVSSFFLFTNDFWGADTHNEIDFEFLGGDTTVVNINYYYGDKSMGSLNGSVQIDLGYDAAEEMHTYGFDWQEDSITWYIDGEVVYEVTSADTGIPIPDEEMKIIMDVWSGTFDNWHGELSDYLENGGKTAAYYSRVSYDEDGAPYGSDGGSTSGEDERDDTTTGAESGDGSRDDVSIEDGALPGFGTVGTNANETLYGGGSADSIDGGRGNDMIISRGGSDIVTGGAGNDEVRAGAGNDTLVYVIGRNYGSSDHYKGYSGVDTLQIYGTKEELADSGLVADIEKLKAFIASNYDAGSHSGKDFTFSSIGLTVRAIEAVELVVIDDDGAGSGTSGEDIDVVPDVDDDSTTTDETDGDDESGGETGGGTEVDSGSYPDADKNGGSGDEDIYGSGSADSINGQGGDDYIVSRGSSDVIDGGAGSDHLRAGAGNDILAYLIGDNGGEEDRYEGMAGFDTLKVYGTKAQLADADLQSDIAALETFMADNYDTSRHGGPEFELESLGLTVRGIEAVELIAIDDTVL